MVLSIQLVILIIITELIIYALLCKCLDTIKACSMNKACKRALESGVISNNDFLKIMNMHVEENKNE